MRMYTRQPCALILAAPEIIELIPLTVQIRRNWSGHRRRYALLVSLVFDLTLHHASQCAGFNALRILRSIGVFDDVLKHAGEDPKDPKVIHTVPRFFSGMDGHELVYDVCTILPAQAVLSPSCIYIVPDGPRRRHVWDCEVSTTLSHGFPLRQTV